MEETFPKYFYAFQLLINGIGNSLSWNEGWNGENRQHKVPIIVNNMDELILLQNERIPKEHPYRKQVVGEKKWEFVKSSIYVREVKLDEVKKILSKKEMKLLGIMEANSCEK